MEVKKTSRYPRVIFRGDFELSGSSAAKLIWEKQNFLSILSITIFPVNNIKHLAINYFRLVGNKSYLADETIMQSKMKLVKAEWLQNRWQNTRIMLVWLKIKNEEASGIGTILFILSASSSSISSDGSINSPKLQFWHIYP